MSEKPENEPTKPSFVVDFEPAWRECPACKSKVTGFPCVICERTADDQREARTAERKSGPRVPEHFAWAYVGGISAIAPNGRKFEDCVLRPFDRNGHRVPLDRARDRVVAHRGAVMFTGPSGAGKTTLAAACLRGQGGAMWVSSIVLDRARAEHRLGDGDAPLVSKARYCKLLVIDDLGAERVTRGPSTITDLIHERHNASLTTWVTTGLTAPEIEQRYGAAIERRLMERGVALLVSFFAPATRSEAAE